MLKSIPILLGILIASIIQSSSTLAQEQTETAPTASIGGETGVEEESPALESEAEEAPTIEEEARPTGNVVNSKYLSITEHRYRNGEFSDQITGTVVNNSTQEISQVAVIAALYDNSGKLITAEWGGFADVSTLPPGDNSAFSITLLGVNEDIDRYTLFPGGIP